MRNLGKQLRSLELLGVGLAALTLTLVVTATANAWGASVGAAGTPTERTPAEVEATHLMLLGERLVAVAGAAAVVPVLGEWQLRGVLVQGDEALGRLHEVGGLEPATLRQLEIAWGEERAQAEVVSHTDPPSIALTIEAAQLRMRATTLVSAAQAASDDARAAANADMVEPAALVGNMAAAMIGLVLWSALQCLVVRPLRRLAVLEQRARTDSSVRYGPPYPPGVLGRLARAFDHFVGQSQRRRELEHEVVTDALTRLYNRRAFFAELDQAIGRAEMSDEDFLVCYVDVNGFKAINDSLGHRVGDQALVDVAHVMRETFRGSDVVARLGGDEFAAIAFGLTAEDVAALRDRLEGNVEEFNAFGGRPYGLSLSTGIVAYTSSVTPDALLQLADEAMYREKHGERDSHEAA